MSDSDLFLKKAKRLAVENFNLGIPRAVDRITVDDVYIVWFAKVLQNWKALVSTDVLPGIYWEITYNGAKQVTYVDRYAKVTNNAIPDHE